MEKIKSTRSNVILGDRRMNNSKPLLLIFWAVDFSLEF